MSDAGAMTKQNLIDELLGTIRGHKPFGPDEAHVEIHGNRVLGQKLVPGLHIEAREREDRIEVRLRVDAGTKLGQPVHLCFGMIPENGIQKIDMDVVIEDGAEVSFLAHCTFPNARKIQHLMDARIEVGRDARYSYFERHIHGEHGGLTVVPKAKIVLREGARFSTEFELIKGRVGLMDIDYEAECGARSVLEMTARISGREDDVVKIREAAFLRGERSRGVLISHIALRGSARAEILNELVADAPYAQGHVDCKEIVQDNATARAVPIVQVNHPKAHVTHEAAIGSVDSKQLQTLMARGLSEDDAVDLIIEGLLR